MKMLKAIFSDTKLRYRLRRIRKPVLVLRGERDRIITDAYAAEFAAAIPGATLKRVDRPGHFPHIEQPRAFAETIFAFAGRWSVDPKRIPN